MRKIFFILITFFFTSVAFAEDSKTAEYTLQIKDHVFIPVTIEVKANQKFKLIVENLDDMAEEFESAELQKEKIIMAGKKATLFITPLKPGTYSFYGEFHPQTAKGAIIAK